MANKTFLVRDYGSTESGNYVQVFKRGQTVLADLNFFDGDRTLEQVKAFIATLSAVVKEMEDEQG